MDDIRKGWDLVFEFGSDTEHLDVRRGHPSVGTAWVPGSETCAPENQRIARGPA